MIKHLMLMLCLLLSPVLAVQTSFADEVASVTQPAMININTADAETLAATLAGVGPSRAEAIVSYREEFGPFFTAEDLLQVRGIGPAVLEKNQRRITLE